jgi:hypothetical protein
MPPRGGVEQVHVPEREEVHSERLSPPSRSQFTGAVPSKRSVPFPEAAASGLIISANRRSPFTHSGSVGDAPCFGPASGAPYNFDGLAAH